MSRSDDPAHWNDGHAPTEHGAQHQSHPNSPQGHAQHVNPAYDPNVQPVHQDPYAQGHDAQGQGTPEGQHVQQGHVPQSQYVDPNQQVQPSQYVDPNQQAGQSQYVDPNQQVPQSQYVDPQNYQQPVAQPQYVPQAEAPATQAYGHQQPVAQQPQGVDPYQQPPSQHAFPPQLDEIANQVQAGSSAPAGGYAQPQQPAPEPYQEPQVQNTEMRHEHSIPSPGYQDSASQYAQPQQAHSTQGAAQQTAEELQAYFNQQPQTQAPVQETFQEPVSNVLGNDHNQYRDAATGHAGHEYQASQHHNPQASDYDLGELMASDPVTQAHTQSTDHFRASTDLPTQSQQVDFGQAPQAPMTAPGGHSELSRDVSHVADHFTQGAAGAGTSLEPVMQNDADFYANEYSDEEYDDYEEPASRMGGIVKLLATLSLAIITGAGLAYGYKFFAASDVASKQPAIIRADSKPAKIQPKDPGGKQFAHSKKAIYDRVSGPGKARVAQDADSIPSMPGISLSGGPALATSNSGSSAPSGGVKRVRTISVKPDGTYAPTQPMRPSKPANLKKIMGQDSGGSIPGITVGGAKPSRPAIKARVQDELVRQIAKPAPVKAKPAVKIARVAPKLSAPVVGTSPNGYVSQISARKSRIDALSAFADLQQRYGSVLSRSQPDIQEANLGAKGIWYRLRIGPPGSKQAATNICDKLKSAGHKGCFVRAY